MRHLRLLGSLAALVITAGCSSEAPSSPPKARASRAPVSLDLNRVGSWLKNKPNTLDVSFTNQQRARPDVTVELRIGLGKHRDQVPSAAYGDDRQENDNWKKLTLSTPRAGRIGGKKNLVTSGSYRLPLQSGPSRTRFRITPPFGPQAEGDRLPVEVAFKDHGRLLGREYLGIELQALSATVLPQRGATLRKDGGWTPFEAAVTNQSQSLYPQVRAQPEFSACEESDDPFEECASGGEGMTSQVRAQWYDGKAWTDVPRQEADQGDSLVVPVGAVPADSTKKVKLRFAASRESFEDTDRLQLTFGVSGLADEARKRSVYYDDATLLTLR
ncbi:hypothetical protein ACFQ0X_01485 [Streptomyces rectiviolaceus]|uniref:Lipoprotein n=1 Tax=Streptomyces rectiviolaceus TaxID=332591 RepID=A0ABP6M8M6_9ACTN